MQWSLIIGTILAAALGVMVDWLLKPLLPERPTLKHLLAGAVFVLVLAFVLVRLSPPSDSTPAASSTDEIRKCMAQHGLGGRFLHRLGVRGWRDARRGALDRLRFGADRGRHWNCPSGQVQALA